MLVSAANGSVRLGEGGGEMEVVVVVVVVAVVVVVVMVVVVVVVNNDVGCDFAACICMVLRLRLPRN